MGYINITKIRNCDQMFSLYFLLHSLHMNSVSKSEFFQSISSENTAFKILSTFVSPYWKPNLISEEKMVFYSRGQPCSEEESAVVLWKTLISL